MADIDKIDAAAALCLQAADECEKCAYYGASECMTALIHDQRAVIHALRAEIERLKTCKSCLHREVCHVVWERREAGSGNDSACEHWRSECTG